MREKPDARLTEEQALAGDTAGREMLARLRVVAALLREVPDVPARPVVLWRNRDGVVEFRAVEEELIAGRGPACDIPLSSARVSRRHCRIEPTPGGARVTDLGTTHGTRLNGRRLRATAELRSGDVIEVAGRVLVYCAG